MTERAFVASPFSAPGGRLIASPFQFITDDDTNLRIFAANSVVGVTIAIQGRRLDQDGTLQPINETHTPASDRSVTTQNYKLGKGAILNLTVFASGGTPKSGQTYVILQLIRGFSGATLLLGTMLAGSVTAVQPLGFPGSAIVSSIEGEPVVRNILGTAPALGAGITETCPTNARWELVSLFTQLTTSAAAGSRAVDLLIRASGGATLARTFTLNGSDQAPSTTTSYTFGQNVPSHGRPAGVAQIPFLQRQFLVAGDTVNCTAQQAGDQFTAPEYQVREWLEVG